MTFKTDRHWQIFGRNPHHGIALPLSALRSEKSSGIGEFYDLLPLLDWCKSLSFDCIQLLPLTDSGHDTSPYNAISSCALDPVYLSLHALPNVDIASLIRSFDHFNQLPRVAIQEVKQKKMGWLYQYFLNNFSIFQNTKECSGFIETRPWLLPYALFKTCKNQYKDTSWQNFPKEAKNYPPSIPIYQEQIDFHIFLQYLCYTQLKHVKDYASSHCLFLKGDLPILLSPDSADVWANSSLFDLTLAAGAPPDYYNQKGQKWGFPLPNWEAMEQTDFAWWRQRLKTASDFYHLYRIDHVVGLFRLWAIPSGKSAKNGYFIPKNPLLWAPQGEKLLEMMLESSPLLPIAEDLGTIPKEVPPILKKLGICGTKVIRWERNWHTDKAYIPYSLYEPFSMTTVSTHDCDTLSGWWQNYPEEAKAFALFKNWIYQPQLSPERLYSILQDAHSSPSYFHINLLQEYLALFPELVHKTPQEERINIPGQTSPTNWTYRFKPSIEEIIEHKQLTATMRSLCQPKGLF